jgi:hypothetical protein
LSGDTLVVGAPLDTEQGKSAGAVHVLDWDGSTWIDQGKLLAEDGHELQKFGQDVAIDGDTLTVSALGAGYVFVREGPGSTWRQQWKFVLADGPNPFFSQYAVTGDTVLARDGNQRPYIFHRRNKTWSLQARLGSPDPGKFVSQWSTVGLKGDTAILGGWRLAGATPDIMTLNVYARTCISWVHQADLTVYDGTVILGDGAFDGDTVAIQAGPDPLLVPPDRIHAFRRSVSGWDLEATLISATAFSLGSPLAVAGDRIVAGEMVTENWIGQARIFTRSGTSWTDTGILVPAAPVDSGQTFDIRDIAINDHHVAIATELRWDATHPVERRRVFVY